MVQLGRLQADADYVVVYFFPQAGAPGCAREAIGFRDVMPELVKKRVRVVGITSSPSAEIVAFAKKPASTSICCATRIVASARNGARCGVKTRRA